MVNVARPTGKLRPLYSWSQSTREKILAGMPRFNAKGLASTEGAAEAVEDEEAAQEP